MRFHLHRCRVMYNYYFYFGYLFRARLFVYLSSDTLMSIYQTTGHRSYLNAFPSPAAPLSITKISKRAAAHTPNNIIMIQLNTNVMDKHIAQSTYAGWLELNSDASIHHIVWVAEPHKMTHRRQTDGLEDEIHNKHTQSKRVKKKCVHLIICNNAIEVSWAGPLRRRQHTQHTHTHSKQWIVLFFTFPRNYRHPSPPPQCE